MNTTLEYINQLEKDKQNLNTMLNNMGVETTGKETFTELTPLVGKIVTDPILQDKTITITENGTTNITADEGYDGLNNVTVTTNVASGGSGSVEPETGIIVSEVNEFGFPKTVTVKGVTAPNYAFGVPTNTYEDNILCTSLEKIIFKNTQNTGYYICGYCKNLKTVVFDENLQEIGGSAFSNCKNLELNELPNSLTTIGKDAFRLCNKVTIKKIPDSITKLENSVFYTCLGLTQISMKNVTTIPGGGNTVGAFSKCTNLKAVWIGSAIKNSGLGRYSFSGDTSLQKIYIDLPRATVESFTYYSYAFSNNAVTTDVIICNDDVDWITREEFDSIDWSITT